MMYFNILPFLVTIEKTIKFRSFLSLKDLSDDSYYHQLDTITCHYNRDNFRIKYIECDKEYASLTDRIEDNMDVQINITNIQDHVPEAERNIQTIK